MTHASLKPVRAQRGVTMIFALFVVVMLMLVALAVLTNTSYSASSTSSIQTKHQTFDAAEAGAQVAQWNLDQNSASTGSGTGTVNGYNYDWKIVDNELNGPGNSAVADPDPKQSALINVPAGQALIAGSASSILGGRTVYVEIMVAPGPPTYLPNGAITCGKTGVIDHQQITDLSGHHRADVRCGTLTASGGGQVPDGYSYATGTTNAITGYNGIAYVNQAPPSFLTSSQLAAVQSNALNQAKRGAPNYYTTGNVTGGVIGTNGADCVAYIAGNVTLKGSANLTNYCATTVVMGDFTIGGTAAYQALPAGLSHIVYVFGSNGTVLQGTPSTVGFFYVANANVTINGGGNGDFTGSVITPNSVTMNGGGTSKFFFPGNQTPPPVPNPNVVPESQWEY